ncbi:hypothetical protein [Nocardia beijingensis]
MHRRESSHAEIRTGFVEFEPGHGFTVGLPVPVRHQMQFAQDIALDPSRQLHRRFTRRAGYFDAQYPAAGFADLPGLDLRASGQPGVHRCQFRGQGYGRPSMVVVCPVAYERPYVAIDDRARLGVSLTSVRYGQVDVNGSLAAFARQGTLRHFPGEPWFLGLGELRDVRRLLLSRELDGRAPPDDLPVGAG